MDEYLMTKLLLATHNTQTPLEKILSNVVHQPLRLIDFVSSSEFSDKSAPEYKFSLTAVRDPKINTDDEEIPFCDLDCTDCSICDDDDDLYPDDGYEPMMWGIPDIDYVIFNDPATVVFWDDGTKTVVKCMKGEKFEKYAGFMAACMKKMFGSTSRAKAIMNECDMDNLKPVVETKPKHEPKKSESKPKTIDVKDLVEAFVTGIKQAAEAKEKKDETPEA